MKEDCSVIEDGVPPHISNKTPKEDLVLAKFDLVYPKKESVTMYGSELSSDSIYHKLYKVKHSLYSTRSETNNAIKVFERRKFRGIVCSEILSALAGVSLGVCGLSSPIFLGALGSAMLSIGLTISTTQRLYACQNLLKITDNDIQNANFIERMICEEKFL